MAHILWYRENVEEKQLHFIQRLKLSNNMLFGSDGDIFMDKKYEILFLVI